jgi:hypothetical protein
MGIPVQENCTVEIPQCISGELDLWLPPRSETLAYQLLTLLYTVDSVSLASRGQSPRDC